MTTENLYNHVTTAFLVITYRSGNNEYKPENLLEELTSLVHTIGFKITAHEIVKLREIHPRYLTGQGKTDELIEKAKSLEVDCIVFDDDLTPSQQRNWEELSGLCVIDRREVILETFKSRAKTKEAILQVELAQMEYSLPRLKRKWTHLSRQRGGVWGTKGEGETQLEIDRRGVLSNISRMKKELKKIKQDRHTKRRLRASREMPSGSIIGYTNAGKSSLLNAMAGSGVFVEDKLFATLDPTTRRIKLPGGSTFLLTDTVGFIRKLPHDLVETFKSTLEETREADFLIHVLDASNPEILHHYQTTISVLEEMEITNKPLITVFNKIDLCQDRLFLLPFGPLNLKNICVSTKNGTGLEDLLKIIDAVLYDQLQVQTYLLPNSRYDLAALIHSKGRVLEEKYEDGLIRITARVPADLQRKLNSFLQV